MATDKFTLLSSESVALTPELAEAHRTMTGSPTERDLESKRVDFLKKKIEVGLFLPPTWSTVRLNGAELRMNGQHSSIALCALPEEFPKGLKVHFDRYKTNDHAGMVTLFRQFDARQSGRTAVDVSGAYMKGHEVLRQVSPRIGLKSAQGIRWYLTTVENAFAPSGDDVGELFAPRTAQNFVLWLDTIEWKKAGELNVAQVIAAMYGIFKENPVEAKEFFAAAVYRRHQFDEEHPANTLENYLCAIQQKDPSFANEKKPKPAQIYESCIQSWNAYRAEKPLNLKILRKVDPRKKGFSEISA